MKRLNLVTATLLLAAACTTGEFPATIFYNASGLFLDESATENQMLRRAAVIAHETSHMWFGDLFFPKDWMDATLGGHNDSATAGIVRAFLGEQKDYPVRLRRIIMQSADDLFRAADGRRSIPTSPIPP